MAVYTRDITLTQPTTASAGSGAEFRAGTVTLANARGLPSGVLTFSGGSLLVGVTAMLNDGLSFANGAAAAAGGLGAATGVVATFTGALSAAAKSALVFGGASGAGGTIVLAGSQAGVVDPVSAVDIRGGVVRIAGASAQGLFASVAFTGIQQAATLDVAVGHQSLKNFASLGVLTSSTGAATLALTGAGTLGGVVTGALSLDVQGFTTVTGVVSAVTQVEKGATLQVGAGGASGSVKLGVVDGAVVFDRSDAVAIPGPITGAGSVAQIGSGVLTLSGWNVFTGGATVSAGVLVDDGYSGVGVGGVTVTHGGALVIGPSQVFANPLALSDGRLAAGHGSVVGLTGPLTLSAGASLTIGDLAHDGALVLNGRATGELASLTLATGTLALGPDFGLDSPALAQRTTVLADATFDLNGVSADLFALYGQGLVTSSGGSAYASLFGADFAGTISGPLTVTAQGVVTLHGEVQLTGGGLRLAPSATLVLDRGTSANVQFIHPVAPGHIDVSVETLVLGDSSDFHGRISNWGRNDTVDLKDVTYKTAAGQLSFDAASDTLQVSDGVHTAQIGLVGVWSATDFAYGDDGSGHVVVSLRH